MGDNQVNGEKPKESQAQSRRQSVLTGMLAVSVLWILWADEIGYAVIAGVIILVGLIATYSRMKSAFSGFVAVMVCAAFVTVILPNFFRITDCGIYQDTIQNTHAIQLAVERYAHDNGGKFPLDLEILRKEGYLPTFPENPYKMRKLSRKSDNLSWKEIDAQSQMQDQAKHPPSDVKDLEGNFIYLPEIEVNSSGEATVLGYCLIGFTPHRKSDNDKGKNIPPLADVQVFLTDESHKEDVAMRNKSR